MDCIQVLTRTQRRESEMILDAELRVHGDGMNGHGVHKPKVSFASHRAQNVHQAMCVCMYLRIGKCLIHNVPPPYWLPC